MKTEIEIKIKLSSEEFNAFTGNFNQVFLEKTFGYFKEDFSNIKEGIFPRIKYIEDKEIIFTVKVKKRENTDFFEREELEVKISKDESVDVLRKMVKSMGFTKEIIFEKKRKNIIKNDIIISFDELPFGFFVEFEGKPGAIEKYLKQFNLMNHPRIIKSYLGLWEDYKKINNISEENCLFKS